MTKEVTWDKELTIEQSNDALPTDLISVTDKTSFDALTDLVLDEKFKVQETTDNKFIFVINWVNKFYVEDETTLLQVVDLYCEKLAEEAIGSYKWIASIEVSKLDAEWAELRNIKIELNELEQNVEVLSMSSILSGTALETKQLEIYKSRGLNEIEAKKKFEEFTKNTNTAVKTYLKSAFGFDEKIYNENKVVIDKAFSTMSIGIQFAMMEILANSKDEDGVVDFFSSFAGTDMTNGKSAFTGLLNTFKWGNVFYELAQKVEGCVNKLALNKNELLTGWDIHPLFQDAALLKDKLKTVTVWNNDVIDTLKTTQVSSYQDQQKNLKEIAEKQELSDKLSSELLEKLAGRWDKKWAVEKSIEFLKKRWGYKKSALWFMRILDNVFSYQIPLLGSVWWLLGYNSVSEFFNKNESQKWIASFVLRLFGYEGVDGLVQEYNKEQIDYYMEEDERNYVTTAYSHFTSKRDNSAIEKNTDAGSTWKKLQLDTKFSTLDATLKQELQEEIVPPEYDTLLASLKEWFVKQPTLPQEVLNAMQIAWVNVSDYVDVDTMQILEWKEEAFAEKYLEYAIPQLLTNATFMKYVSDRSPAQEKEKTFLVGMFGHLVAGKFFVDGIDVANVGLYTWDVEVDEENPPVSPVETVINIENTNESYETGTVITTDNYLQYIRHTIERDESWSDYGAVNEFDAGYGVSLGNMQWHRTRAEKVCKKMHTAHPDDFATVMGQDFVDAMEDATIWTEGREKLYDEHVSSRSDELKTKFGDKELALKTKYPEVFDKDKNLGVETSLTWLFDQMSDKTTWTWKDKVGRWAKLYPRYIEIFEVLHKEYPADLKTVVWETFIQQMLTGRLWCTDWHDNYPTYKDKFKKLMAFGQFQNVMDEQVEDDMKKYVETARRSPYNFTWKKEIIYFGSMQNAGTGWARKYVLWPIDADDTIPADKKRDLDVVHAQLLKTDYIKKYSYVQKHYETLYTELKWKDFSWVNLDEVD